MKSDLIIYQNHIELESEASHLRSTLNNTNTSADLSNSSAENKWLADIVRKDSEVLSFYDHVEGKYSYENRVFIQFTIIDFFLFSLMSLSRLFRS